MTEDQSNVNKEYKTDWICKGLVGGSVAAEMKNDCGERNLGGGGRDQGQEDG